MFCDEVLGELEHGRYCLPLFWLSKVKFVEWGGCLLQHDDEVEVA